MKKSFFTLWQRRHVSALRLQNVLFDDRQNRLCNGYHCLSRDVFVLPMEVVAAIKKVWRWNSLLRKEVSVGSTPERNDFDFKPELFVRINGQVDNIRILFNRIADIAILFGKFQRNARFVIARIDF